MFVHLQNDTFSGVEDLLDTDFNPLDSQPGNIWDDESASYTKFDLKFEEVRQGCTITWSYLPDAYLRFIIYHWSSLSWDAKKLSCLDCSMHLRTRVSAPRRLI